MTADVMTADVMTADTLNTEAAREDPIGSSHSPLDLLRDRDALFEAIGSGDAHGATVRCLVTAVAGAAIFGISVGAYSHGVAQAVASMLKMPILLLGTALLTFPSFFVLQSWRAPQSLDWRRAMALLSAMVGATGLVWGALAPPVLFLVLSTGHYDLAQLLSIVVGAFGGLVGLWILLGGYRRLCDPHGGLLRGKFLVLYFALFGVVGGQMGWMLRPYVGSPGLPFQAFRPVAPGDPSSFLAFLLTKLMGG